MSSVPGPAPAMVSPTFSARSSLPSKKEPARFAWLCHEKLVFTAEKTTRRPLLSRQSMPLHYGPLRLTSRIHRNANRPATDLVRKGQIGTTPNSIRPTPPRSEPGFGAAHAEFAFIPRRELDQPGGGGFGAAGAARRTERQEWPGPRNKNLPRSSQGPTRKVESPLPCKDRQDQGRRSRLARKTTRVQRRKREARRSWKS